MSNPLADLFDQGNALFRAGDYAGALTLYDQALALHPGQARVLLNRGQTLRKLGRMEEAAADLQASADNDRDAVEPLPLLAQVLLNLHRPAAAVTALERAITLRPLEAERHRMLGIALRMDRRIPEAIASFQRGYELDPALRGLTHVGACQLMLGDYANGWRNFETRGYDAHFFERWGHRPRWMGESGLRGKTMLVHAEQGLGDTIMLCRFIPIMAAAGMNVLFAPQPSLRRLMRQLPARIVDLDNPDLCFDYSLRTFTLPLLHGTTVETIPNTTPYLTAEPALVEQWRGLLGPEGFKIGVAWRGSGDAVQSGRSFDPALLAPLATLPGVRLISLQKDDPGHPPERLAALGIEAPPRQLDADGDAFVDTAAVMAACDLIVTLDSAVAHLAGALARPVWIALSRHSEWRWLIDRTDSPWHPTARLWRQTEMDDWEPVFAAMRDRLSTVLAAGETP